MNTIARIAAATVLSSLAAVSAAPAVAQESSADGARIASNGGQGFAACASCHGAHGEGQAAAGFPRLTGQTGEYLANQLHAYATGQRVNSVMQPIAKAMSAQQQRAVSDYYAQMASPPASAAQAIQTAQSTNSQGRILAMVGVEKRTVQACANCHGPDGAGQWPAIPALAGQHASYLKAALAEWRDGSRKTDPSGQMPRIAQALTDAEVAAVAAYYAALPAPTMKLAAAGPAWTATRTITSGPVAKQDAKPAAPHGTGVEQGAAVSGGTQGVGSPPASSSR